MALRGAQGDHPTEGREAPEAQAAQPSQICGVWKAQEGYQGACRGGVPDGGMWKAQTG